MTNPIACAQLTWKGVEESIVLEQIFQAGYDGSPPKLDGERPAVETLSLYHQHGLRPAPGYFAAAYWHADLRERIVADARRAARLLRELGCSEMFVATTGDYTGRSGRTRAAAAGHVDPEDALSDAELDIFVATVDAVATATLEEGVASCFHNHVGTVIETVEELERLLERVDPQRLFLGPDTGHLAWAGADPVAFCRRHIRRIRSVHLKDIDDRVRRQGVEEHWDYSTFVSHGIFTELGQGCVDFAGILGSLRAVGYDGWLIVETDITQRPTAAESATISRQYLHSLGV